MAQQKDKVIKKIVEVLKKEFKPKRLFLFGSRAGGTHHTDSDYDFVLVVADTQKNRIDNMGRARDLIREACQVSADVFVYPQSEFEKWKDELSSIPETAVNTGQEIDLG